MEAQTEAKPASSSSARVSWSSEDPSVLVDLFQSHGFADAVIDRLVQCASAPPHPRNPLDRIAIALGASFNFFPLAEILERPLALFGLPGAGTSSMVARLAARFDASEVLIISVGEPAGESPALLSEFMDVLDLPVTSIADIGRLGEAVAEAQGRKVVLDINLSALDRQSAAKLSEILAASGADGVLVLSAETEKEPALAAAQAAAASGARRVLLTHLDTTRYLGAGLEAILAQRLALIGASVTPHFGFGLRPLTPENLARRLMSAAAHAERWRVAPL